VLDPSGRAECGVELLAPVVEDRGRPGDRRAKLVVPTERGREVMRLSDEIIGEIERREAATLGKARYEEFRRSLGAVVDSLTQPPDDRSA
jgi:DNA-binding MarR family transcriptional regulator